LTGKRFNSARYGENKPFGTILLQADKRSFRYARRCDSLKLGELQSDHTFECRYISLLQYRARTRQQSVWTQTTQARAFPLK
jgi:hypothetical protein